MKKCNSLKFDLQISKQVSDATSNYQSFLNLRSQNRIISLQCNFTLHKVKHKVPLLLSLLVIVFHFKSKFTLALSGECRDPIQGTSYLGPRVQTCHLVL